MSTIAAVLVSVAVAGCGKNTYFAGRELPPSKLTNRVLIAIQNPSILSKGALQFVDAYYDTRSGYNGKPASFSISGFSAALPISIQNMPDEQLAAVYASGDGTLTMVDYSKENTKGSAGNLNGPSSSVFITRNQNYVFAANQAAHVLTVINRQAGSSYTFSLPGIYRVSVNAGGSAALVFVQNSNYVYYPVQLTSAQTLNYSGGPSTWPKAAMDCEPQAAPGWCLMQAQSPDSLDATGNYTGAPLVFDRPVKAVFSPDGGTAYVLSCGQECGGSTSAITPLPVAPMIFTLGQTSGKLPTQAAMAYCAASGSPTSCTLQIPGGANNALIGASGNGSRMYVAGQHLMPDGYWAGTMTVVNLATASSPASIVAPVTSSPAAALQAISISDGIPDGPSRMIEADDNTLWIAMTKCTNGERAANAGQYTGSQSGNGCLTMYNESTGAAKIMPYLGDATGVAAVTSLHKIYTAEGGQIYIYNTADGSSRSNEFVTVTGTAYDVAYMDGVNDANNTVY